MPAAAPQRTATFRAPVPQPAAAEQAAKGAESGSAAGVIFSAAVVFFGGWYWVDEIPRGRDTGAEYSQLLQAIAFALGWPAESANVERFDWPLPQFNRLDSGLEAARHSFEGFMRARMERQPPQGVVLLGSAGSEWLNLEIFAGLAQLHTVSAWQMLRQVESKAQAWQDLQPLRRSS